MAWPAGSPRPFMVTMPGATVEISTLPATWTAVPLATVTWAVPGATVDGTRNTICDGETEARGAAVVAPAASRIETEVPETALGYGAVWVAVAVARFCPLAVASDPGAMAVAAVLAAERISGTLAEGVDPAVGASDTPRKTSPALAVRTVVNCSEAAVAALVLAITSVMETRRLGSAPVSPLALTVDVVAQMVTVPSPFTLPVMLRRPSVAGLRDVG